MGKTSLAKRIIRDTRKHYDYVFLLSAEFESKLLQDFKSVFHLLELGERERMPADTHLEVFRELVVRHLTETSKFNSSHK